MSRRQLLRRAVLAAAATTTIGSVDGADAATVTCGQVITASITVDNDLTDCTGKGLVVGANDITIDLNGHTIDSTASIITPDIIGVDVGAFDRVTVRNGRIAHFRTGVRLGSDAGAATDAVIVALRLDGTDFAISEQRGARNIIAFNEATGFGSSGGAQINLEPSSAGETTVAYNVVNGPMLVLSPRNRIEHNQAPQFYVGEPGNHVAWNVATGTGNFGTRFVVRGSDSTIEYNTVGGLGAAVGIYVESSRNVVRRNIVLKAEETGLLVSSGYNRVATAAADNVLLNNTVSQGRDGIVISGGECDPLGGCKDPALRTLVRHNRTRYNSGDGIRVEAPQTTLTRNVARHNGDLGIEAVAGVTDGGENRAAFNGNPAQCVGVVCGP
jgi:hypothetical protein